MSKWSKKFGRILTAAGISAFLAVGSLAVPIAASAATTNTDNVMIRNDASTEAGAIGKVEEKGTEVTILESVKNDEGETWYYIQLENGNTGYIRSDLIEASEEEIAAAGGAGEEQAQEEQAQEEQAQEEPKEEPAQEPAQEQNTEEQPAAEDQKPQEAGAAATEAPAAQGGDYDATKDPNAAFRVSFDTDDSGNGEWYVHNDDNGSKWKVSDLQGQGGSASAASAQGVPKIWRTLAILFGLLVAALAAFVLFLLKSIRDGRSKTTRGRALEAAAAAENDDDGYDDDEYDDDEYYFEDDDDEVSDEDNTPDEENSESDETVKSPEAPESAIPSKSVESSESGAPSESVESPAAAAPSKADAEVEKSAVKANEKPVVNTDSTITMDVSSETEVTQIPTEEIEAAIAATTAKIEKNIAEDKQQAAPAPAPVQEKGTEDENSDRDYAEEEYEDSPEDNSDEENPDEDSYENTDEDYEDEDYEDEDYEDEDYDDDEYEEEDDEENDSPRRSRSSSKGGFFGFLKKMFGSDSKEDTEDEGEDFDDYEDEPEEHEFDEYKEYPEDVDLLPKEEPAADEDPDDGEEDFSDRGTETAGGERGRLSMQRVMKNVSYKEEEADFSDDDDISDSLFDDDDDMEYSFISNTRNKK
ncbi:MAG: SH3 domain-containing protein [Lachnospiraceae bacterium]|nr:SH3 domain-containing protein [Lachnospiraceae bacterium]